MSYFAKAGLSVMVVHGKRNLWLVVASENTLQNPEASFKLSVQRVLLCRLLDNTKLLSDKNDEIALGIKLLVRRGIAADAARYKRNKCD